VILDRQLCFGPQVSNVIEEANKRTKMMYAVSGSDWGGCIKDLRMIFQAFCWSKLMYAPSAWQAWLSETQIDHLEVCLNKASRIITGQYSGTPIESSRTEAGLCSMRTAMKREALRSGEKARRMPEGHPRLMAWEASEKKRSRKSWRSVCKEELERFPEEFHQRKPLTLFPLPPWTRSNFEVHPNVPGLVSRHEEESRRRDLAMAQIDSLNGDWIIYTDGSAEAGTEKGGSAVVVTSGEAADPVEWESICEKGAALTCSYEEEQQAMLNAAKWIQQNSQLQDTAVIATDSQSLCSALQSRSEGVGGLIGELSKCPGKIIIQWIPGHSEIPGNEMADRRAKEATLLQGAGRPVSYQSACAMINRTVKDPPVADWEHARSAAVYSAYSAEREKAIVSRKDQVLLARVRSGKYLGFAEYRARIKKTTDASCPRCGAAEEDLVHWLQCPGTMEARVRLFGNTDVGLDILTLNPTGAVKLAQSTLRLGSE
jgi:ribonuclease HI